MHINIVLIVLSTCVYEYVLLNHNFHSVVTVGAVVFGSAKEQKARERYILFSLKISVFRIKYLKVFKESYT